jgi:hypothetical protein
VKYPGFAFALSLAVGAVSAESVITINGKTIRSTHGSIAVQNSSVIVDGRIVSREIVEGPGNRASEQRDLGDFDELRLHSNAEVIVTAGPTPKCEINGSGNAEVHAREAHTANINGGGDLSYLGSPASVRTAINGSGSVRRK